MVFLGSMAPGEATAHSDIDGVVYMRPNLLQWIRLKAELEALLGWSVDVIRYRAGMNLYLKARIVQEAQYVYTTWKVTENRAH